MQRILILLVHPALEKSRVQYRLAKMASTLDHVQVHDLYEHYPDFMIDVAHEQQLLRAHDIILFQHPFYWYSSPALLKEWQDLVLEHGFAYGKGGDALKHKVLANVLSAGGSKAAYCADGQNQFSVHELLRPFEQTAHLCGMHYLPPFVVHDTNNISEADIDAYAGHYRQLLHQLGTCTPGLADSRQMLYLNDWDGLITT